MRTPTLLLLTTVVGLEACKSCAQFNPPSQDTDTDTDDPLVDVKDSGDTGPIDTGPPPPCPFPETEDNDLWSQAEALETDVWACGVFAEAGDQDTFYFEIPEPGWYRMWARAADFGSFADVQMIVSDAAEDYTAIQTYSTGSTDPMVLAYLPVSGRWYVTLAEQYSGYSDQHEWKLLVSESKVPLEWDFEEVESNNAIDTPNMVENGQRVYGVVSSGTDRDWFAFEVGEGKTDIDIKIEAWNYGSPLDSKIDLYSPAQERKASSDRGSNSQDQDAVISYSATASGTWSVLVKFDDGEASGGLYWYVVEINWDTTPTEE